GRAPPARCVRAMLGAEPRRPGERGGAGWVRSAAGRGVRRSRRSERVMRILAIRGCNLASLAGEVEIDLARGALASAGVFALVGPTGAGKSTLLDAMCVALFDRTPRLTNRSTVVVGRG